MPGLVGKYLLLEYPSQNEIVQWHAQSYNLDSLTAFNSSNLLAINLGNQWKVPTFHPSIGTLRSDDGSV